jgi:hypothetical protein
MSSSPATASPPRASGPSAPAPTSTSSAWLHLAVLWTLAVAQPLFQLLADSPEFLIVRGNGWPDILLVSLALVLLPPSVLVAIEVALGRSRSDLRRKAHLVFVGLLAAALFLQVAKDLSGSSSRLLLLVALAAGVGLALVYDRGSFLPTALTVLAPVPLLVLIWFLAISPASELAFRNQAHADDLAGSASNPVPVVLVIFDELAGASLTEGDRIDRARYPAFAELADSSTWYPNATTVEDNTIRAVPAILTGRFVHDDALPVASDQPPSIFDRMAAQYDFHIHEPITRLCTADLCRDSRADWPERARKLVLSMGSIMRRRLLTQDSSDFLGFPSDAVDARPEQMREYIDKLQPGRTLNLLHMVMPHSPYWYGPDGRRYTNADDLPGLTREQWGDDAEAVADAKRRYVAQLRFTDELLGELIAKLRTTGLYDDALVVVTADHGVSFHPNASRRYVTEENVGEIGGVPLFIKAPGQQEGGVDPQNARTIDILPTIADVIEADWAADGRSLRRPPATRPVVVAATDGPAVKVSLERYVRLRREASEEFDVPAGGG